MEYENVSKLINSIKNYKCEPNTYNFLKWVDTYLKELEIKSIRDLEKELGSAVVNKYFFEDNGSREKIEKEIEKARHYKDLLKAILDELNIEFELSKEEYRDKDEETIDIDCYVSLNNGEKMWITSLQYEFLKELE